MHLRWFDYWLKGKQNGALDNRAGSPLRNRDATSGARSNAGRWHVGSARSISAGTATEGSLSDSPPTPQGVDRSYRYDPLDPAPTQMDVKRYPIEDVPVEMTEIEARADVLTYTSEPLDRDAGRLRLAATGAAGPAATATTPNGTSS